MKEREKLDNIKNKQIEIEEKKNKLNEFKEKL